MQQNPSIISRIMSGSIVLQILIGMLAGIAVASFAPDTAKSLTFLGSLFVKGLKAVAPVLVFVHGGYLRALDKSDFERLSDFRHRLRQFLRASELDAKRYDALVWVGRIHRDALVYVIGEGTSEIQKMIISKRLLDEYRI